MSGTTCRVVTSSATASRQSRIPLEMSRSELPVIAFAEPDAEAALLASHFSPPSLPLHGATRIATVHAIMVWPPPFVTSIFFTVDATMYACALFEVRSLLVGRPPPGQVVEYPVFASMPRLTTLTTRSLASFGALFD